MVPLNLKNPCLSSTNVRHKVRSTVPFNKTGIDRFSVPYKPFMFSMIDKDGFTIPLKPYNETMNPLQTMITTENFVNDKKNNNYKKIKKDTIGITKTHEKNIKSKKCIDVKNSIQSLKINTKNHEIIKKDSIGITKTQEKIIKDCIAIAKTNEKIIKSKKRLQKSKNKGFQVPYLVNLGLNRNTDYKNITSNNKKIEKSFCRIKKNKKTKKIKNENKKHNKTIKNNKNAKIDQNIEKLNHKQIKNNQNSKKMKNHKSQIKIMNA